MSTDPRHEILFEPVRIGPVVAPNRFFQVPHATGLGYLYSNALAAFRAMRAEGGWGVISTGACDIHYTSDHNQFPYERNWDDSDIPSLAKMADAVHAHGALAALELNHSGINSIQFATRTPNIAPSSVRGIVANRPTHARAMDKEDIRAFRSWHRAAALRAKKAGYDIVYVYAAHQHQVIRSFLLPELNKRTDEYGGSVENRSRLLREVLEDTKDAVGDTCAVALRFSVEDYDVTEPAAYHRAAREIVEHLAEIPDLWDVNLSWPSDAPTSRFGKEGMQQPLVSFMKQVTTKPVVGVGRFTSPDSMVSQIRSGVLDLIGAARPSIADPFLPSKIKEGRIDAIRECIGCNVCIAYSANASPILCTQNPTASEEWRRGWHPERIRPRGAERRVLVVGSGPAGLECASALGRRGYEVDLAERERQLGGRVTLESRLPGLSEWSRVRDHRLHVIEALPNVGIFRESPLSARDILQLGYDHVVLATGARWRRDGIGSSTPMGIDGWETAKVFTPDDVIANADLPSPVVIYDDDHNYMASVLAEKLVEQGKDVVFVTPGADLASWTAFTLEQGKIVERLRKLGVGLIWRHTLKQVESRGVRLVCAYTRDELLIDMASLLYIGNRLPNDELYADMASLHEEFLDRGLRSVRRIGDCHAPGLIANAVFSGREYAEQLDANEAPDVPFRREVGLHAT